MADGIPLRARPQSASRCSNGSRSTPSPPATSSATCPRTATRSVEQVVTIEYAVYPIGMKDRAQTGRVARDRHAAAHGAAQPNQAPVARSFSASVSAGDPLTITVPTSGVDPDGDSVTVAGHRGRRRRGRRPVAAAGSPASARRPSVRGLPDARPAPRCSTTRSRDRFGATSTRLRADRRRRSPATRSRRWPSRTRSAPPRARRVTVDATQNDLIARGDAVDLEYKDAQRPRPSSRKWKVDARPTRTSPPRSRTPGRVSQHLTYGISNGLFDPSRASITVRARRRATRTPRSPSTTWPSPRPARTPPLVDVLANDRDIDGDREPAEGRRSCSRPRARIEGNQVRVKVLDHPYTVPYVITDEDGATAMALIYVPDRQSTALPFVVQRGADRDGQGLHQDRAR